MKFSVIMASTLAEYGGAASRRDEKIVRAIDSVIAQTFTDWELIVVDVNIATPAKSLMTLILRALT